MIRRVAGLGGAGASAVALLSADFLLGQAGLSTALALTVAAAFGAVLLAAAVLPVVPAGPVRPCRVRTALRERSRRTAFLPQWDPDAAGRPRPRAPGGLLRTAA